jgi:serralysin
MATLTLSQTFEGIWPPDSMAGGTITLRQATRMLYTSDAGFAVALRGSGLTYDDDGLPSGGTVTGFTISKNGVTFANLTGTSVDFARAGMQLFGHDDQNGGHVGPDPYNFLQNALRNADLMNGSASNDEFFGTIGNDTINAGAGFDGVGGEDGADVMDGGADWDTLYYDTANYSWSAFRGVNLDAAAGTATDCWGYTDTISNFEGFKDSSYSDTLRGADVDEEFYISRGNDIVDGRGGFDWLNYQESDRWGAHRGVNINLATGVVIDPWKGTDTVANIEGLRGTIFNDTLTGTIGDESFLSGRGVDVVNAGGGQDRLGFWILGDDGFAATGVTVDLTKVKQVINDGYGNAETATGIEDVDGSPLADRLTGNEVSNRLWGGDDNDTLIGGGGEDFLDGGWGNDVISGGTGNNDHIDGGGDNDTLTGNAGNDNFNFGWDLADAGVDTITDFNGTVDLIHIASWWGGGFVDDVLASNQFRSGAGVTTANTATQRVIYNSTTGDLYFDQDGAGGVAAVKFATLSNLAALTFDDIHVMF